MKRPLAYITAAWCGSDHENAKLAAQYCRAVYEAGFSPICPTLYQPLFLNDAVPEEQVAPHVDAALMLLGNGVIEEKRLIERHRHGARPAPPFSCAGGVRSYRHRGHEK